MSLSGADSCGFRGLVAAEAEKLLPTETRKLPAESGVLTPCESWPKQKDDQINIASAVRIIERKADIQRRSKIGGTISRSGGSVG